MTTRKIATCCYCGTRAALVLKGKDRHELSCATCGAPLHELKKLPRSRSDSRPRKSDRPTPRGARRRRQRARRR